MKTKEKILQTALTLFNANGVSNVSVADIGKKAIISKGNITYHFPKKDEIILALFIQMRNEMIEISKSFGTSQNLLEDLLIAPVHTFDISQKYKFLSSDSYHLTREFKVIRDYYKEEATERSKGFIQLFIGLQESGYIEKNFTSKDFEFLIKQSNIFRNNWFTYGDTVHTETSQSKLDYILTLNQLLKPYLTNKGLTTYEKITKRILS